MDCCSFESRKISVNATEDDTFDGTKKAASLGVGQDQPFIQATCHVLDDSLAGPRRGLLLAREIIQELKRCK
jgi:hypothetical protein